MTTTRVPARIAAIRRWDASTPGAARNREDKCKVYACTEQGCTSEPRNCDDNNPCTGPDECDPQEGCVNPWLCPDPPSLCLERWCNEGECDTRTLDCNDDNDCTAEHCDPEEGCVYEWLCESNNPCIQEYCLKEGENERCVHVYPCDDRDPCTRDECKRVGESYTCQYKCLECLDCSQDAPPTVCKGCGCQTAWCSVSLNSGEVLQCGQTELMLTADCGPNCGSMTITIDPLPGLIISQPQSVPCEGGPRQQTIIVTAPGVPVPNPATLIVRAESSAGAECDTQATIEVIAPIDVSVDSNNDGQIDELDDAVEDDADKPGKYIWINDDDNDNDLITDYGDGFNLDGEAENADDLNSQEAYQFTSMLVRIADLVDPNVARIKVQYSDSKPAMATFEGDPRIITPAPGRLRIWTKEGTVARKKKSIGANNPGDFVADNTYDATELGLSVNNREVQLWIEGVRPSASEGSDRIRFSIDLDGGPATFDCEDAVRVTLLKVDLDIDSDNTNGVATPDRSDLEDVIEGYFSTSAPGKCLRVNRDNDDDPPAYYVSATDHERIDDFGDGYNRDGVLANEDDVNSSENDFVPVVLELPQPIDISKVLVSFLYTPSDPAALTYSDAGPNAPPNRRLVTPAPGRLRVWTKPGSQARNSAAVFPSPSGDFFPSPQAPVGVPASVLGFTSQTRTITFFVEGIEKSPGTSQTVIGVQVDPDGASGPASWSAGDHVRTTVVDVQFEAPNSNDPYRGFDFTINPNGLMVPLPAGNTNAVKVRTGQNGAKFKLRSTDPTKATVPSGTYLLDFDLEVTSVGVGETVIEVYTDTPDQLVVGDLRAYMLQRKELKVKFHHASDNGGHSSVLSQNDAQAILDRMNEIWQPQANVEFTIPAGLFVTDPQIQSNLGAVVQFYDIPGPPCNQTGSSDWRLVTANEDSNITLDVFFAWEYEQDCPPDENAGDSQTEASASAGLAIGDDAMSLQHGVVYGHEAGHHMVPSDRHFLHGHLGAPPGDWNHPENLMGPERSNDQVHISLRQAKLANDALAP